MKTNIAVKQPPVFTHEGAPASRNVTASEELRRAVMACLLWEDQFYESGALISDRIKALVPQVPAEDVAAFAVKARTDMKLRHAPLLLVREMARGPVTHRQLVAKTLAEVVQRADELAEFLSIYWLDGRQPLSAQVKKGLAKAFGKFNEYAFAKYDRDGKVKLRDALFLCHAKPTDAPGRRYTKDERKAEKRVVLSPGEKLYRAIVDDTLTTPDTWEVALSAGEDKKVAFTRLLMEKKLGALALLRNLRNMTDAGVEPTLIHEALAAMDTSRVLPHRFIAAARAAPSLEPYLEHPMLVSIGNLPLLLGRTIILVDVPGSMDSTLSAKSDMTRLDAGCGLAIVARELCESVRVFTFSQALVEVPPRKGFALRDAVVQSQQHASTYLGAAVSALLGQPHDRLIVITDEQSHDVVPKPSQRRSYMLNVASAKNGVGYGEWNKIDGFSEAVVRYIAEVEQ
jgi:hypothetical protein